jgi:hypothetical protein
VTGESSFPEELVLDIQVFENFDFRVKVACAVEIFPADQRFKLTPFPLELKKAMDETMRYIAIAFEDQIVHFRGQV